MIPGFFAASSGRKLSYDRPTRWARDRTWGNGGGLAIHRESRGTTGTSAQGFGLSEIALSEGDWYWEITSGFRMSGTARWGRAGIARYTGVVPSPSYASLVHHTDNTDGPGQAQGNLLPASVEVIPSWPQPLNRRIRNRLTFAGGTATWMVAIEDGEWQTLAEGLEGAYTLFADVRGSADASGNVAIYSQPDTFNYPIPAGAKPLAASNPPHTLADFPEVDTTQYSSNSYLVNHVIPLPEFEAGDLMVVCGTFWLNASTSHPNVTGWTRIVAQTSGAEKIVRVYYKVMVGNEANTFTFYSGSSSRSGPMNAWAKRYKAGTFHGIAATVNSGNSPAPDTSILVPDWRTVPARYTHSVALFAGQTVEGYSYGEDITEDDRVVDGSRAMRLVSATSPRTEAEVAPPVFTFEEQGPNVAWISVTVGVYSP